MSEVFISYASEDRPVARMLAEALEQRGWDVWWDRDIPLGKTFDEVIEQSIARAKCVIVLWSTASVASEWVRSEASEGRRRNILVPAFIEPVEPPLAFRLLNSADLTGWTTGAQSGEFDRLILQVTKLLGPRPQDSVDTPPQHFEGRRSPASDVQQVKRGRTSLIVTAAAVIAVGAGLAGYWAKGDHRERDDDKHAERAKLPNDLGIGDAKKNFNEVLKALGGAIPATSLAKGFHVPDLGVRMAYLTQEQSASTLGAMPAGAVVMEVESGRPMAKAGIHVGDVILSIRGSKIAGEEDLRQAIFKIGPGKTAYSYRRGEETKTVNVDCPNCKAE
jgi:hypothetical protein